MCYMHFPILQHNILNGDKYMYNIHISRYIYSSNNNNIYSYMTGEPESTHKTNKQTKEN